MGDRRSCPIADMSETGHSFDRCASTCQAVVRSLHLTHVAF